MGEPVLWRHLIEKENPPFFREIKNIKDVENWVSIGPKSEVLSAVAVLKIDIPVETFEWMQAHSYDMQV